MIFIQDKHTVKLLTAAITLMCLTFSGCREKVITPENPQPDIENRKVMILYSDGHNNLNYSLNKDIKELINSDGIPQQHGDVVLIYTHPTVSGYAPSESYLLRAYRDADNICRTDTLMAFHKNVVSADSRTLYTVLTLARSLFPAKEYGLVITTHGTGYLPYSYYSNSDKYEGEDDTIFSIVKRSIGADAENNEVYEMDIRDFAEDIPFKLKYIVFDACLMGGVEVAYQLRNKTDYIIASQTEILSDGMDYNTMAGYLLSDDYAGFCENYFNFYNKRSGSSQSATISLIDCSGLASLAEICKGIFGEYQNSLAVIDKKQIQRYYRTGLNIPTPHFFYDFKDIVSHSGCDDFEMTDFNNALEKCILYKAATEYFMGSFSIERHSGLSMFLPCDGGEYLKAYYRTLDWNKATGLVPEPGTEPETETGTETGTEPETETETETEPETVEE